MSFKASLFIEDQELRVLDCEYSISQNTDHKGKPSARPQGGIVSVVVESTSDTFLFDWAASESQIKSGSITFYRRDTMSKMKELRFTDAYCVDYTEHFSATGEYPMDIELMLSAKELSLGGSSKHANPWTKNGYK